MIRKVITGVALLCCSIATVYAQDATDVLNKAQQMYRDSRYDDAAATIFEFVRANGKHPANEQLIPLLCESLIRKGDGATTLKLYDLYKKKYAASPFMGRMYYCAGYAAYQQKNPGLAMNTFSLALGTHASAALDSLCVKSTFGICNDVYMQPVFDGIRNNGSLNGLMREIIDYFDILKQEKNGKTEKMNDLIVLFKQRYPRSRYQLPAVAMPETIEEDTSRSIPLALLAPLTGADNDIGRSIMQGAMIGLEKANATRSIPLRIIERDTKSSPLECANQTLAVVNKDRIKILIGPMLSSDAVISASILACGNNAVMLSPTATDDGIAELSSSVFLVNTTLGALGSSLARYAIQNLTIREFAIIAPSSAYGTELANSFKAEALRLGATIIATETYIEGTTDFRAQFESLRSQMFYVRTSKSPSGKLRRADSLYLADTTMSLGGLFIPSEAEDAVMLAAQAYYYKIRTQMLGANGWHSPKVLANGGDYVNNALIASDYPVPTTPAAQEFKSAYKTKYKQDPDRIAALGYDAVMIVSEALGNGGGKVDPAKLSRALLSLRDYQGVAGRVSFSGKNGANQAAAILKIANKQFVPIQ